MRRACKRITAAIMAVAAAVTIGLAPAATAEVPAANLTVIPAAHGHGGHGYGGHDYGHGYGGYRGPGYGYGLSLIHISEPTRPY